jgi:branched-chain amino acid transport system ATP-binding protein
MTPALEAIGLSHRFGANQALSDLSFRLMPGEVLAMIGPNGAGKSTCFAAIGGQLRPERGRVLLFGADITALPAAARARAGLARSFQTGSVFASMSARENVQTALAAAAGRWWRPWRAAPACDIGPAEALLDQLGLADLADITAAALPPPQIKRLDLAIALAAAPRLLLLDEPAAGLAAAERRALTALIRRLARERGLGILFTEHDMDSVFALADRILVLDRGARLAEGTEAEIRADPAVRAAYLGEPAPEKS